MDKYLYCVRNKPIKIPVNTSAGMYLYTLTQYLSNTCASIIFVYVYGATKTHKKKAPP